MANSFGGCHKGLPITEGDFFMKMQTGLLLFALISATATVRAADLPGDVAFARSEVIRISSENTLQTDNIAEVRAQLAPFVVSLSNWFAANRPANEVALTQKPWKNLWYDDPDISDATNLDLGFFSLIQDRNAIYQVVQDGYYYNVSESILTFFGFAIPLQNYLKGEYQVSNPAGPGNAGEPRLNVVDLRFASNAIALGPLGKGTPLDPLVFLVDQGWLPTIPVPGPIGVTGELWNLYIDEELRVSAGIDKSDPSVIDIYILRRATVVE